MRRLSFLLGLLGLTLLLSGFLAWSHSRNIASQTIHPAQDGSVWRFDDRVDGGRSISELRISRNLVWSWFLDTGATWPYLGVEFALGKRERHPFDVSRFDSLVIEWKSLHGRPLRVICMLDVPGFTDSGKPLSRRYAGLETTPPRVFGHSSWPLSSFETPMWWFRANGVSMDSVPFRWDRLLAVSIQQGESASPGYGDTIEIRSIQFVRCRPSPLAGSLLVLLGAVLLAGGLALLLWKQPLGVGDPGTVVLQPTPLDTPPARSERVKAWLEANYHRSDLSLDLMAREFCMSSDAVSQEVRKAFGIPFKTALNGLRLEEARRLLCNTEFGIAEIAFKVGYGSVPHFNRIFREQWGRTPTEERESARRGPAIRD